MFAKEKRLGALAPQRGRIVLHVIWGSHADLDYMHMPLHIHFARMPCAAALERDVSISETAAVAVQRDSRRVRHKRQHTYSD